MKSADGIYELPRPELPCPLGRGTKAQPLCIGAARWNATMKHPCSMQRKGKRVK
ncbi:MAG: hypothetical protein HY958_08275 [Bacteroidia bacterium]|nr:hypothetical protein [Bacteroidia bacterium]